MGTLGSELFRIGLVTREKYETDESDKKRKDHEKLKNVIRDIENKNSIKAFNLESEIDSILLS